MTLLAERIKRRSHLATWLMLAVLWVGFGLRVLRLGYQELRGDEAFGYFFSLNTLAGIVRSTLSLREPHPVAIYFLQKSWLGLAGHSEFALRFTSIWFGVLAIALLYRLGRRLGMGCWAAALAAALMAISPYAVWHSQDARMYTMSLALTLASTWLALEVIHSRGRLRYGLAYVLMSLLALHTHYFVVFVLLAQTVFVLGLAAIDRPMRRIVVRWLLYQALLGLLYLPWLLVAASTLAGYAGAGDSPSFALMLQRSLSVFGAGETVPLVRRSTIAALSAILLLIGAVRVALAGPLARRGLLLLALYLAVPVLITWASALQRPIFNERYLIAATPPFFLLLAAAVFGWGSKAARPMAEVDERRSERSISRVDGVLGWLATVTLGLLLLGALGSLASYYTNSAYSKTRGWRELAATLERYTTGLPVERTRIAQNFPDPTLAYYYHGPVESLTLPPVANDDVATLQEVDVLVAKGVERVVIPIQPVEWWDPGGVAENGLAKRYALAMSSQVGSWPVHLYVRPPDTLDTIDAEFANGLVLAEAAATPACLVPGGVLVSHIRWDGPSSALTSREKISLQLLDASGRLVAQTDQPFLAGELGKTSAYAMPIPWLLPSGEYRAIVALYDPSPPGAPRLLTRSGADHVELGSFSYCPGVSEK